MTKRIATGATAGSAVLIGAAYAAAFLPGGAPAWAPWALAFGTAAMMVALMALGAARPGRSIAPMLPALAFTFVVVAGGFGLALAMPAETAGSALWLGLPPRAAVVLYGIGLLPTLVLPLVYALTFDRLTLSEEDVARVRALSALGGAEGPRSGLAAAGTAESASAGSRERERGEPRAEGRGVGAPAYGAARASDPAVAPGGAS